MATDPIEIALRVARVLEERGVRYLVGGSLASSFSGEPRSTLDVDLVVALSLDDVEGVVEALGAEFYSNVDSIRRAIHEKSSANIYHIPTATKIDLFIMGGSPVDEMQMDRRQLVKVAADPDAHLYVYAPEDILLQKLRWYQLGHGVSDRQWNDILAILRVQGDRLDLGYTRRGAQLLEVAELFERALSESRKDQ